MRAGLPGDGGEDDFRSGDGEIGAVMLADGEYVDADGFGVDAFGHDVAQHLGLMQELAVGSGGDVAECVQAELDCLRHGGPPSARLGVHLVACGFPRQSGAGKAGLRG